MILLSILTVLVIAGIINLLYYYNYVGSTVPARILSAPKDIVHYTDAQEFLDVLRDFISSTGFLTLWISTPVTFILAVLVRGVYKLYFKTLAFIEVYVLNKR